MTPDKKLEDNILPILKTAKDVLKADMAHIGVWDEEDGVLRMKVCPDAREKEFKNLAIPFHQGMGATVAITGKPARCENYYAEWEPQEWLKKICLKEGIISGMAVPMRLKDEILGVLWVFNRSSTKFDDSHLEYLSVLGAFAALEVARWKMEIEEQNTLSFYEDWAKIVKYVVDPNTGLADFYSHLVSFLINHSTFADENGHKLITILWH